MHVTETTSLFTDALITMNAAMEANEDRLPYSLFMKASRKLDFQLTVGVAVYKDNPETPHDYYTVCYHENRIELVAHGKEKGIDIAWNVSEDYLQKLHDDPERYIKNPALLDWDWLKSRLGV